MKAKSNESYKTLNYKYQNIQTHVTRWIFFFTTRGGGNKPTDANCPCPTPCRRAHSSVQHSRDTGNFLCYGNNPPPCRRIDISDPGTTAPVLEGDKLMNVFFIPQFCSLRGTQQSTAAHTAPSLVCWALRRAVKHMLNSEHANSLSGKKI